MHIALFHQYHHNPDCPATCRHYTFMTELAKRHQITLITSNAWESKRLTQHYHWVPPGVNLISIEAPYSNKMGVVQRLRAFSSFASHAVVRGLRMPKPDVIWGVSTPLTTAWAAAQVARFRKVPWVFEVQDLWPSFPIQMGAVPSTFAQQQLYRMEASLYRQAVHIIPLSPDMERYIVEKGVAPGKVTTLVNGTEIPADIAVQEQEALREKLGLKGRKVVLYAGTYGRANDIPLLVKTAELLQDRPDLCFVFTGQGYDAPLLEEAAGRLPNIKLLPPLPRHEIFKLFSIADVSVVSFIDLPVLEANSPGKLFDSLAVGTPVVVTNPGWTKTLVEAHSCGWYVPAGEAETLASTLVQHLADQPAMAHMRVNAAQVAREQFDRAQMVPVLEQIFENCLQTNS
ncbi:glycosyltransferase family 4 protein [Rufibacter psychrotolerans]|uniref:glycosyltransferase family 4 protein n=1 Tax=Rufibacter psychrotolerans TaxID=2812556 RepID=UPI0019675210|nr:glycosyltransferase family 4 protein [Rufibacter sp. SYSU D00308]